MSLLQVAIIQSKLYWEDAHQNRLHFRRQIELIEPKTDLIVLPEMFTSGFTMNTAKCSESMSGDSVRWMSEMAKQSGAALTGSLIIEEHGNFYNRLIWMRPSGEFDYYDKKHLFRLANEQQYFTPGTERKIVTLKDWRINLNVCYDLRFPVWLRNQDDYDCLLFVANWPEKRREHWKALLKARAIENLCFVIACNRVGTDGKGFDYSGDSGLVSPNGACHFSTNEEVLYFTLDKTIRSNHLEKFGFHLDRDEFIISS